jgi:hypothetical protein
MYIEAVPNRNSPPAILLRESYRHEGKVRKRTLCNLSDWAPAHIEGLRGVLKGGTVIPAGQDAFTLTRSLPHGHVAAALGTARRIGLDRLLGPDGDRCRDLVLALLIGRILDPVSKLAAARTLSPATASSSLGEALGLGTVADDELYAALDWLLERQPAIETALAKRHLQNGTLVLYDVSSSYLEGRCCPLAQRGYNRDGKKGMLQIVYGLLCAPDGCPVAIEVFAGNTGDPTTLGPQIDKLKQRFGLTHVVLVGDRGLITEARISADIKAAGLDWITALRGPAIKELLNSGLIQLTLFDTRDMAAITSPDFPGERLVVCRNADLAAERARKREELLVATETDLAAIKARVERNRDRGAPRDAAPPTPPGIRVRTTAVRRIKLPPSSYGNQVVAGLSHSDDAATAYTSLSQPGSAVHATRPSKRRHVSAFQCYRRCETSPLLVLSFNPLRGPFGPSAAEAAYYALC